MREGPLSLYGKQNIQLSMEKVLDKFLERGAYFQRTTTTT
jgi:hypothetical protein